MHTATAIIIRAPRDRIFEVTADLENWTRILPHYRYIHYLERGLSGGATERHIVKMAATRDGIPIAWTSEQVIDRARQEVRFTHLKAFTKGMHVVWTYTDLPDGSGVRVEIVHDLKFRFPPLQPLADRIIGSYFIENIANKTLRRFKEYLEPAQHAKPAAREAQNPKL
ncbi:MAG: SRPBCC family protein [Verrucomicrobia bacterium]|nr:SRPBCC family protein [Verrucomicrobiota bacterium]